MVTIVKQKKESLMLEYIKYARCYIHIKPFLFYLSYLVPLSCHNVSDEECHGLAGTLWLFVQPEKKMKSRLLTNTDQVNLVHLLLTYTEFALYFECRNYEF